ncbi:MAG TPA: tetratricopeptide repeat protein, partial [Steroidobacteraceae bacterium]|nr:tetratricopeptide repeat protein [Steroidobacteraceae bacterium]
VFSSKANTAYTQLFLTHIDENGESTPPVLLERFTATDRAANIPEFVSLPADAITKIKEQFLDAYSFLRAGMANERTGNYAAAVRAYERGLAVDPQNVELLNSLGFALFQQDKSKEAIVALEKAVAIDPKHWKAHNNLALAAVDIGELELAEAHYRDSLAIKPQPAIYNDLGVVLEREGLPEEALAAFRKAVKLDPASASAHFNLGSSLVRSRKFAEAERHLRRAVDKDPNAQTYTGLAIVLSQMGRSDEAIANLKSAIEADPTHATAYDQLGTILVEQGKLEDAATTYQGLIRHRPSAAAHQNLAKVLERLGRTAEARREIELAQTIE